MYNRYQGNTGEVVRVDDQAARKSARPTPEKPSDQMHRAVQSQARAPAPPPQKSGPSGIMEQLGKLLPNTIGELETDDIILLLILYLMYRESGDSELLIIMGAMFLL